MADNVENITSGVDKMNVSGDNHQNNEGGGGRHQRNRVHSTTNDEPIMVRRGETGVVKWFSFKSGYGFIAIDNSDEEVFVHSSAVVTLRKVFCVLHENDQVEFDVIQGSKGLEAIAVTGHGGKRIGRVRPGDRYPPNRGDIEGKGRGAGGGGGGRRRRTTSQGSGGGHNNEKNSGGEEKNGAAAGEEGAEGSKGRKPNGGRQRGPRGPRGPKRTSGGEKFVDAKESPEHEGGEQQ